MTGNTTGAMRKAAVAQGSPRGGGNLGAGLVLLYAEEHLELPSAWSLETPRVVIGREPSADLFLPVQAVSRIHAEIAWESNRWMIRDLQSRNGVLLDGHPVKEAPLEESSELRIGDALLKFVEVDASHYCTYRIDGTRSKDSKRPTSDTALVGGLVMDRIAGELVRIAPSSLSVVVLGESGTGKEVAARELHRWSGRRGHFRAVNCAALPATLLESELFGYRKGAFSGADRDKPGLIRMAHEGTLLLDEIGDMPLEAQAKLLRVLQSRELLPLGATTPEVVDVRIVCATHRDLTRRVRTGQFRNDLYARLNEYQVTLPPLRDRKEDLFLLVGTFLERYGRPDLLPSFGYMLGLIHYDWPYNVRELEACVKRSIALGQERTLTEELLPDPVRESMLEYGKVPPTAQSVPPSERFLSSLGRTGSRAIPSDAELRALLERHRGNVAAVGRELGKARMQIHRWMQRYGIDIGDYR